MAELVKIENTEMAIKEYNGMRVVTMKDIDRVHHKNPIRQRSHFKSIRVILYLERITLKLQEKS